MSIKQSFILALRSLANSKTRSILTMLGIIIGVGAVIIIISLGDGMQAMMDESFESMGTNLITVNIMARNTSRNISVDDMYELADKNPDLIDSVSPVVSVSGAEVKYGNESYSPTVTGVSEDYYDIKAYTLTQGRFLEYIDIARLQNVCVVGSYLNNEVFNGNTLGSTLKINGNQYTVVGVLEELADSTEGSNDDIVIIPYTNAAKLVKNAVVSQYNFSSASDETASKAKSAIENRLYKTFQDSDLYYVMSMTEMLDKLGTLTDTLMIVLVAIAGISLLVGGIGIMNIMLVSVTERTREIGIRKSLGGRRRDIRTQFVIEAGTTSAVGGIIGIIFGVILASLTGKLVGITAVPSFTAISVAFGVSVGIGIIFGYLPANKAACLNPIDALRYE